MDAYVEIDGFFRVRHGQGDVVSVATEARPHSALTTAAPRAPLTPAPWLGTVGPLLGDEEAAAETGIRLRRLHTAASARA